MQNSALQRKEYGERRKERVEKKETDREREGVRGRGKSAKTDSRANLTMKRNFCRYPFRVSKNSIFCC